VKQQLVDKTILERCVPIKVSKEIANVEAAYGKLFDINNEIEVCDYKGGFYSHIPEIARGESRAGLKRAKELWEEAEE